MTSSPNSPWGSAKRPPPRGGRARGSARTRGLTQRRTTSLRLHQSFERGSRRGLWYATQSIPLAVSSSDPLGVPVALVACWRRRWFLAIRPSPVRGRMLPSDRRHPACVKQALPS